MYGIGDCCDTAVDKGKIKQQANMDRATFEKRKAFAGEKVPSMKRRCVDHDYTDRCMYMVTLVVEGRRKLLGHVEGRSDAPLGAPDTPRMVLSELGKAVADCWASIPQIHPEVKTVAMQMMPDHLHGILFVSRHIDVGLGKVILGFKQGCNKAYRGYTAVVQQYVAPQRHTGHEKGFLFERSYNDKLLLREGQLQRWLAYLADNPRRLLAKQEHPDLFRVHFNLQVGTESFAAIGNRFLLQRPYKLQVQCSRSLTDGEIAERVRFFLAEADKGAVLVSPALSKGEKTVMRAAMDAHKPLIFLSANSFTPFTKPGGTMIEACSRGELLILAPWEDRSTTQPITRSECLALNGMAKMICEDNDEGDCGNKENKNKTIISHGI